MIVKNSSKELYHYLRAFLMIVLIHCSITTVCASSLLFNLYDRIEEDIEWKDHNLTNPFADAELLLQVKAPGRRTSGSSFYWMGFFDGNGKGNQQGNIWKFRVLLDTPGIWEVKAIFVYPGTQIPVKNAPAPRSFRYNVTTIPKPGENGHLTIDPQNQFRFRYVNDKQWIPFPIHSSTLLDIPFDDAKKWITQHAGSGINALTVRFHAEYQASKVGDLSNYHFLSPKGNRVTKWSNDKDLFDYSRFDLVTWHHNEKIIELADSLNIALSVWFGISGINRQYWSYGPVDYPSDSELGPLQKLFIRYFLARWASYTCWWHWTIDSEYEETGAGSGTRVRTYAAEMKRLNPWPTMLTTHVLRNWSFDYAPELDFATLQRRVEDTPDGIIDCKSFIMQNMSADIPVYNSEGVWSLQNKEFSRISTLVHLFAGGYSHIAHSGQSEFTSSWFCLWDKVNPRHKEDAEMLGQLTRFFNSETCYDFNRCLPANDLIHVSDGGDALCLADKGRSFYIYLNKGGKLSLDLNDEKGIYEVWRYRGDQLFQPVNLADVVSGSLVLIDQVAHSITGNDYIYILRNTKTPEPSLTILTNLLPDAVKGLPYHFTLKYRDALKKTKFYIKGDKLPGGLHLKNNTISGIPAEKGTYSVNLMITSGKETDTRNFTLRVLENPSKLPLITNVRATLQTSDSIMIEWRTDMPAGSRVQWGNNVGNYTGESGEVETNVTNHKVLIKDRFTKGQKVYFLVISANESGKTALYESVVTIEIANP